MAVIQFVIITCSCLYLFSTKAYNWGGLFLLACVYVPFSLRKAFARFRCSSHKFNTEIGRHRGIARADRICLYCFDNHNLLVVDDEYHVSFKCGYFLNVINLMP